MTTTTIMTMTTIMLMKEMMTTTIGTLTIAMTMMITISPSIDLRKTSQRSRSASFIVTLNFRSRHFIPNKAAFCFSHCRLCSVSNARSTPARNEPPSTNRRRSCRSRDVAMRKRSSRHP